MKLIYFFTKFISRWYLVLNNVNLRSSVVCQIEQCCILNDSISCHEKVCVYLWCHFGQGIVRLCTKKHWLKNLQEVTSRNINTSEKRTEWKVSWTNITLLSPELDEQSKHKGDNSYFPYWLKTFLKIWRSKMHYIWRKFDLFIYVCVCATSCFPLCRIQVFSSGLVYPPNI